MNTDRVIPGEYSSLNGRPVWVVLQTRWIGRVYTSEFQGVFTNEDDAKAACRNHHYYLFPTTIGHNAPDETTSGNTIGGYYPIDALLEE